MKRNGRFPSKSVGRTHVFEGKMVLGLCTHAPFNVLLFLTPNNSRNEAVVNSFAAIKI